MALIQTKAEIAHPTRDRVSLMQLLHVGVVVKCRFFHACINNKLRLWMHDQLQRGATMVMSPMCYMVKELVHVQTCMNSASEPVLRFCHMDG